MTLQSRTLTPIPAPRPHSARAFLASLPASALTEDEFRGGASPVGSVAPPRSALPEFPAFGLRNPDIYAAPAGSPAPHPRRAPSLPRTGALCVPHSDLKAARVALLGPPTTLRQSGFSHKKERCLLQPRIWRYLTKQTTKTHGWWSCYHVVLRLVLRRRFSKLDCLFRFARGAFKDPNSIASLKPAEAD